MVPLQLFDTVILRNTKYILRNTKCINVFKNHCQYKVFPRNNWLIHNSNGLGASWGWWCPLDGGWSSWVLWVTIHWIVGDQSLDDGRTSNGCWMKILYNLGGHILVVRCKSLGWWVTIQGMLADHLYSCNLILILWLKSVCQSPSL